MATPPELTAWLDEHYPSPRVDPEWLDACYAWVTTEQHLNPEADMPAIIEQVESQLLQSDLCDSMAHGTGIPLNLLTAVSGTLHGPVLVEITALTEVGSSALALDQVRVARAERLAAGAGLGDEENEADLEVDGEGPVPNYPRSMLRFELSDGATALSAIEYRPLPGLTLGVTPLGYKVPISFSLFVCRTPTFFRWS
jgi:RecQ-mediated genome instability protein 1